MYFYGVNAMTKPYESNLPPGSAENIVDLKQVESLLLTKFDEINVSFEKANGDIETTGKLAVETKSEIEKLATDYNDLFDRVKDIEQKGINIMSDDQKESSLGRKFIESDQYSAMIKSGATNARLEIKAPIINATGQNQPLVPSDRLPGIAAMPNRLLTIRDILPATSTTSNLIEFVRESVFTNSAGPQVGGSPEAFENVVKPESGITFTLVNEPVQTIAHWIPASKQVINDSPQLESYISGRLTYGLKLKEETQLLNGSGANGELNGLITQATAYTVQSPNLTNELDVIRDIIKQAQLSEYMPDYILLNPTDWYDIDVRKVGASDDRYIVGNPREMTTPRLWGLPVVVSNSVPVGNVLIGNFMMGAEIKDRNESSVEVSREHSDNFTKNMVTILAEERIALCVFRTEAFIYGAV